MNTYKEYKLQYLSALDGWKDYNSPIIVSFAEALSLRSIAQSNSGERIKLIQRTLTTSEWEDV